MLVGALLRSPWLWLGVVLLLGGLYAAHRWDVRVEVADAEKARDTYWNGQIDGARADEAKRQADLQAKNYAQGVADGMTRADDHARDQAAAPAIVREIVTASPDAGRCAWTDDGAQRINRLRGH